MTIENQTIITLELLEYINKGNEQGKKVVISYLHFSKSFDKVVSDIQMQ